MKKSIILSFIFSILFSFLFVQVFMASFQKESTLSRANQPIQLDTLRTEQEGIIVNAVAQANEAVVSIVVTKDVPVLERYYEEYNPFGGFWGWGGFSVPRYRENGTEEREVGGGSGFIVSPDGFIVTNRHVVDDDGADYTVFLNNEESYDAEVVAKDPILDIAILQIKDIENVPFLDFANSDDLQLGQTVIAIGNALAEFRNSISVGVVSGLSRTITAGDGMGNSEVLDQVIQTDAAINPGNSGGPLLNSSGQVIGVNVAVARGSENIGFALPSNVVRSVFESVQKYGEITRPFLGVRYTLINESIAEANNLDVDYGALIQRGSTPEDLAVMPGSPADKVGIVENDIILEVEGEKISRKKPLATLLRKYQPGDSITLKILSKGEEVLREVELEKFK